MKKHKKGVLEKFDPKEVPGLLVKAKAGDIEARDELLFRFQRLVSTLVNVCITGRPNYWSSYQLTFLKMFASKTVPITNIAAMLKKELSNYEKEELFSTGQLAVLLAIEKCETNLASTIVVCFKDLIHKMIKDPKDRLHVEIDAQASYTLDIDDHLSFDIFLNTLDEDEYLYVYNILEEDCKKQVVPESLKLKFSNYLGVNFNGFPTNRPAIASFSRSACAC